jgi:Tat protein secretion system quality control protein TatD with DNase activity
MTGSYYEMSFAIRSRINEAQKSASVVLVHRGAWEDIWAVVDITATDSGSVVHAYSTSHALMKDFAVVAKRWASGDFTCQQYAITTRQYPLSE